MKSKITLLISFILIAGVIWYLLVKPEDYMVRFTANTTVGTLNQSIKSWQQTQKDIVLLPQPNTDKVVQNLVYGDSTHQYTWTLKQLTDSTSKVVLGARDLKHSLANKIAVLTGDTFIQEKTEAQAKDFIEGLRIHLDDIKITLDGESVTTPTYTAYVTIKGTQLQKASGMMTYYSYLSQLMIKDNVEQTGAPFIEVTDWNQAKDSLSYNFCFPIKYSDKLPEVPNIKYKRFYEKKALKATFNGNYISSDRAWYRLLAYAKANNIAVDAKPIEVFYNNPNFGGAEKTWKAEVFMPIIEN